MRTMRPSTAADISDCHYPLPGGGTACGRRNRRIVLDREVDCPLCLCFMSVNGILLTLEQREHINRAICPTRRQRSF